jgi:hypothetical protein
MAQLHTQAYKTKTAPELVGHLPADDLWFRMLCVWTAITVNYCSCRTDCLYCCGVQERSLQEENKALQKEVSCQTILPPRCICIGNRTVWCVSRLLCSFQRGRRRSLAGSSSSSRCSGTSRHRSRSRQAHRLLPSWWGRINRDCHLHKTSGTILCSLLLVLTSTGQRHIMMMHPACWYCMHAPASRRWASEREAKRWLRRRSSSCLLRGRRNHSSASQVCRHGCWATSTHKEGEQMACEVIDCSPLIER